MYSCKYMFRPYSYMFFIVMVIVIVIVWVIFPVLFLIV